jgi:hypothetical protein
LTLLADGEIVAAVYNHPSHGFGSGNVELWVSSDEGRSWSYRSTVSDHAEQPLQVRMNHAVGLNRRGELIALVSGWSEGRRSPRLPMQVCVSPDGGRTWRRHQLETNMVAYGDIRCLEDGTLACVFFAPDDPTYGSVYVSLDDGGSWQPHGETMCCADETNLLCADANGVWLAASRTIPDRWKETRDMALPHGAGVTLRRSTDGGRTWDAGKPVSPTGQDNAHLLRLADGRLLLSLTSRIPGLFGVVMRISEDEGLTWGVPFVLVSVPATDWRQTDCGYPSTVQLADGTLVTAYYIGPKQHGTAHGAPWHRRYHMGVVRWKLDALSQLSIQ